MTRRVYSVTGTWSLLSVARLLRNHHISGVPVIDRSDRVVGVLSESDLYDELHRSTGVGSARGLLDLLLTAGGYKSPQLLNQCLHHLRHARVAGTMRTPAVVLGPGASLGEAAELMNRHGFNRLPVVDEGRLVGIVSRQDLVEAVTAPGRPRGPVDRPRYRRGPPSRT